MRTERNWGSRTGAKRPFWKKGAIIHHLKVVHLLRKWEKQYAPQRTDEVWHPLFVEALEKKSYIEYLLDILLYDTPEEKKALVAEQRKEVMKLEQRIAGHTAEHDRGRSQRKSGLDR